MAPKESPKSRAETNPALVKRLGKPILFQSLKLMGVPASFQPRLKKEYAGGGYRGVLGFLIWEIRHKLRYGHRSTTINPSVFCENIEQANYIMTKVEGASKNSINPSGIEIAYSLNKRLGHNGVGKVNGSTRDAEVLKNRVNAYLHDQVKKSDASPELIDKSNASPELIDKRLLYEIEGRSGFDPDVLTNVSRELETEIFQNIEKKREKQAAIEQVEDFSILLNLYQSFENLDAAPFLCSHTLLSVISNKTIMVAKREIHLGVFCTEETIAKISEYLLSTFNYTLSEKSNGNDYVHATHSSGLKVFVWRYEDLGAHMVARNSISEFCYTAFDFKKISHNNFPFRTPKDIDRYLSDQFGPHWATPKLYNHTVFDYRNIGYTRSPESLEFLTKRIVDALKKNHRRPASRAIEDLADYFGIDFLPYIPTREVEVETPASRRREKLSMNILNGAIVVVLPNAPSSIGINTIQTAHLKHDHVTVVILGNVSQTISNTYKLLRGVGNILPVADSLEWQALLDQYPGFTYIVSSDAESLAQEMILVDQPNDLNSELEETIDDLK